MAGQIPLVPATLDLIEPASWARQAALSWQHVRRLIAAAPSGRTFSIEAGIVWVGSSIPVRSGVDAWRMCSGDLEVRPNQCDSLDARRLRCSSWLRPSCPRRPTLNGSSPVDWRHSMIVRLSCDAVGADRPWIAASGLAAIGDGESRRLALWRPLPCAIRAARDHGRFV